MNAYDVTNWIPLDGAMLAAAAALVGLVFVGISINLSQILSISGLTGRAAEPIVHLVLVLLVATTVLIPGQSIRLVGAEILLISVAAWLLLCRIQLDAIPFMRERPQREVATRVGMVQLATVPFLIGGLSTLIHHGGGLYWMAPGFMLSFVAAMIDAWVLLVEILR
jgi:modulator of FtsH protease